MQTTDSVTKRYFFVLFVRCKIIENNERKKTIHVKQPCSVIKVICVFFIQNVDPSISLSGNTIILFRFKKRPPHSKVS